MKVKVEVARNAAQRAINRIETRRSELKAEYDAEVEEMKKSWWGRVFGGDTYHWADEYNWHGHYDLELAKDLLKALRVVAEDTVELTTKEAVFVSRWTPNAEDQ